jgi:7-cyano-7-deazaguanine reductase
VGRILDSPLGKATRYPDAYDPSLLYPIERAPQREALGLGGTLPFHGVDRWTAWETGWLDASDRPRSAIARFTVPCTSPRLVESKSVKLWLVSLNNARFDTPEEVRALLERDLSEAIGARVGFDLHLPARWAELTRGEIAGESIDDAMPNVLPAIPDPSLLRAGGATVEEALVSHAFRSVCPVTGQPDYACVTLRYRGAAIDRRALLGYLTGFRREPGFHEHCVERIFVDVQRECRPERLSVEARFTRRGGVDINPFRTSERDEAPRSGPTLRQ